MKGLELAELYYKSVCEPKIIEEFPKDHERIAAGLVGEGSEAFGFDDEISQDHDFTPLCCFWLSDKDNEKVGYRLNKLLEGLPDFYMGYRVCNKGMWNDKRRGVWSIKSFYHKFLGMNQAPVTIEQWRRIPEGNLAAVTNGKVFTDSLGEFTAIRSKLLEYYPEDIRKNKIATRCMNIAQAGQYNLKRCSKRNEIVAARIAETEFIKEVIYITYLLNKRYMPYYKWMHKGLMNLPIMGQYMWKELKRLVETPLYPFELKEDIVEGICNKIIFQLNLQGLSNGNSDFLLEHGSIVQKSIEDYYLRNMNPWIE